ncbi:hypothetical protein MJD09_15610, partial [bacterium]|nr:hypothetical protein [bacterium]
VLMEELPIREAIKQLNLNGRANGQLNLKVEANGLDDEIMSLQAAKSLALFVFNEATCKYGQDLKNEQQISCLLSDVFTDIYLMDSVLSRVSRLKSENGSAAVSRLIAKAFCAEKVYELSASARKILCSLADSVSEAELKTFNRLSKRALLNSNLPSLKQRIAEDLYERGQYSY